MFSLSNSSLVPTCSCTCTDMSEGQRYSAQRRFWWRTTWKRMKENQKWLLIFCPASELSTVGEKGPFLVWWVRGLETVLQVWFVVTVLGLKIGGDVKPTEMIETTLRFCAEDRANHSRYHPWSFWNATSHSKACVELEKNKINMNPKNQTVCRHPYEGSPCISED